MWEQSVPYSKVVVHRGQRKKSMNFLWAVIHPDQCTLGIGSCPRLSILLVLEFPTLATECSAVRQTAAELLQLADGGII